MGKTDVVDHELRFVLAAGEALSAAGLSTADLIGRSVREALGPVLADENEPRYRQALAGLPFHDASPV